MYTLSSWDMKSQHSIQVIITDSAVPKVLRDTTLCMSLSTQANSHVSCMRNWPDLTSRD